MPELLSIDGLQLNNADSGGAYTLTRLVNNPPKKRPEWQERNDGDGSGLLRDPLVENRTIEATVEILTSSRDASQTALGAIVDKLEEAEVTPGGSSLVWRPEGSTRALTYFVLTGELTGPEITVETGYFAFLLKVDLTLTCKPYGYVPKVTGPIVNSASPLVTLDIPSVGGDVPAEAELIVSDAAGQQRDFVAWGLEQRYQAGNDLLLTSDQLTTSGASGALVTRAGSVSTQVIRATLNESPVVVAATGNQPHVGTFRVYLRGYLQTTDLASTVRGVRLAYRVGDGPLSRNSWVIPPVFNAFCELDLGTVTVPLTAFGGQRWQGLVEAYSDVAGDLFDVDYLELLPTLEGFGKARRTVPFSALGTVGASYPLAFDSGVLTGKALAVGGTWGNAIGDSDDWQAISGYRRSTASDSNGGRGLIAGTPSFGDTIVQHVFGKQVALSDPVEPPWPQTALIARWVDWNNYLQMHWFPTSGVVALERVSAWNGTTTKSWGAITTGYFLGEANRNYWMRLQVSVDGRATGWIWPFGGTPGGHVVTGFHPDLRTGGSLASGRTGIWDLSGSTTFINRNYRSFTAAGIGDGTDAVIYPNRSIQFRFDDALRDDSAGVYVGQPQEYRGAVGGFMLPPAGDGNLTSRVAVMARPNDIETADATDVNNQTLVAVNWTERWYSVPA